nr:hypothetical protein [Candidatus Njordarchaeota archaeon]
MTRFLIQEAYRISGVGTVLVGQVTSGILKAGMRASIESRIIQIATIEAQHKKMEKANPGETVGVQVRDANYKALKSLVGKHLEFH